MKKFNIYIASCSKDGGICQYSLQGDGTLLPVSFAQMDRPMYMTSEGNKMYVLLRSPFCENEESALVVCDILPDGSLGAMSDAISTKGQVACHLSACGGEIYCANYISGSIIKMPDKLVTHHGKGINPLRQEAPHAHYIGFTPDKEYVCAVDLGLDTIFLYDTDLKLVGKASVPKGHGARHLVFSDDGKYCFVANELKSTVSLLKYKKGNLEYIETVSCIPEGYKGETTASAIRFKDNNIYVSNRGLDSITLLELSDGNLIYKDTYSCNGNSPRDFDIFGDYIVCTNEKSDSVTVLKREDFKVVHTENNIKSPLCVIGVNV